MSLVSTALAAGSRLLPATRAGRLMVLIYHRVRPTTDGMFPGEVDAERFTWQMALLARHLSPLPLAEGVRRLRDGSLPPRAVAVTFDDGYADNAAVAWPILERAGVPATFFIATGFLDGGIMWNDAVIESVRRAKAGVLDMSEHGLGQFELGSDRSRGVAASRIVGAIKHFPPLERQQAVQSICARVGATVPADLMMTSEQLAALAGAGADLGAHTISHPILRTLAPAAAQQEIEGSRAVLERITGKRISAFAYPNGRLGSDYTERDRDIVEGLGFDFATSTQWGACTATSDRFQLPRFTPWDRTPARWLARLLLAYRNAA